MKQRTSAFYQLTRTTWAIMLLFALLMAGIQPVYAAPGDITTVAGTGSFGYSGDNGPATNAKLYNPRTIAVAGDGTHYIADTVTWRIRKVASSTAVATPGISIDAATYDADGGSISVPVRFASDGAAISAIGFTLDYAESCLSYVNSSSAPNGFQAIVNYDGTDLAGELDVSVFDNNTPIDTLGDGTLLTLNFAVNPTCITSNGSTIPASFVFANSPAVSFSDTAANDVAGTATGGTLTLRFNAAPTAIALSPASVNENEPVGTTVGTLSTVDPDSADSHTYTFVAGANDNASFTLAGATLKTAASFDFETKASYTIRVRTTDSSTRHQTFEQTLTVTVNNRNEAPTGIGFTSDGGGDDSNHATLDINENSASGQAIATLSPTNPEPTNHYTFALVDGEGSSGNSNFTIIGNELRVNGLLNAEAQSSYTIRVRITDDQGNTVEQIFTVTINNSNDAPVAVADLAPAIYMGGQSTVLDLLANDSDEDGDALSITGVDTTGTGGTVTNNGTNVRYTAPNANGSSTFTYQASDGQATSNRATVTVTYIKPDDRGDCNANGVVTAADFTATVLEIFDHSDGLVNGNPAWWLIYQGDYAGSPRGCDSTASENGATHSDDSVTAADITCTVLIFFGNTSCTVPTATTASSAAPATLSVSPIMATSAGTTRSIAMTLATVGHAVASASFALVLDPSQVGFDPTDGDGDGVPDAVVIHAPASMTRSVHWNSTLQRLEAAIFGASLPLPTLGDGELATVTLTVAADASGAIPLNLQLVSLGDTNGDDVPVTGQDGTLRIGSAVGQIFLPFVQR